MTRESKLLPLARSATEFLVEELDGEVLVYDQSSHRAHCLTPTAAKLWRMCDGKTSRIQAQESLGQAPTQLAESLAALDGAGLLASPVRVSSRRRVDRSRRALFSKSAVAVGVVLASPILFSIVSPSVAQAASNCGALNQPCCASAPQCQNGLSCLAGTCQNF